MALSLNSTEYANTGLSFTTIRLAFRKLPLLDLAYSKRGEAKRDDGIGEWRGVRSRLRANRHMRALMASHGLQPKHIHNPPIDLIKIADPHWRTGSEPPRVTRSRAVLERVNALLAKADLFLCEEAWERICAKRKPAEDLTDEERKHLQYLGNMTAKQVYRSFTETWEQGGRLYGGWWMGVERGERRLIQIDGEQTAELDYGQLQPTLLFARVGGALDYDPYTVPGYPREVGKDWFMRLLNQTESKGGGYIKRAKDVALPPGITAEEYTRRFKQHLAPICHFFGKGMGLTLQCEDSELALAVLDTLAGQGIVAMPIHDSFIVKRRHEETLRSTMIECFRQIYGFDPVIKPPPTT